MTVIAAVRCGVGERAAVAATLQASVGGSGAVGERWCGRARARLNELKWRGEKRKGNT
jgi:hypothetical protein